MQSDTAKPMINAVHAGCINCSAAAYIKVQRGTSRGVVVGISPCLTAVSYNLQPCEEQRKEVSSYHPVTA